MNNKLLCILFLQIISISTNCLFGLQKPYNSIEKLLPLDLHGWFNTPNKNQLTYFIKTYSPKIIVEIGVWHGKSATYMAQIMPDDCILYAIDHFKSESEYTHNHPERTAKLYEQFLSNVIHLHLTNKIIPVKADSTEAANILDIAPDLVYIDGSHEEENVFNDICTWEKKLNIQGILCGDDYDAPAVKKGVDRAAKELGYQVFSNHCFWFFNPKKGTYL